MDAKKDFQKTVEVDPSIANSAYDLVGSTSTQNAVGDFIWQSDGLDKFYAYVSVVSNTIGKLVGVNATVDVKFIDGSSALYIITGINGENEVEFDYMIGESIDGENNTIPDTLSAYGPFWSFQRQQTHQEFLAAGRRMGIGFSDMVVCRDTTVMRCIQIGENKSECFVYHVSCP